MFVGEEPGVDAVEQDGFVAGVGDEVFPGVVAGPWGFDEDDPGAPCGEVHAAQDGFFVAFDVDFQEVDGAVLGVLLADGGEGAGFDGLTVDVHAEGRAFLAGGWVDGREAGAGDAVEGEFVGAVAGHALQVGVVGALLAEGVVVGLHRLDVDAGPATVVEGFGDGIVDGVVGADVDVEAVFELFEGAPQADVFEILCVRNEGHCGFLSVGLSACITRAIAGRNFPSTASGIRRLCPFG